MQDKPAPDAPFDVIAAGYDLEFTETAVGKLQRNQVWQALQTLLPPKGQKVLELNCGTGADALWMCAHDCQVLATDISPNMVAITQEKAQKTGNTAQLTTSVCAIENLSELAHHGPFDLVFSNFGGLNCVSPAALQRAGKDLYALLQPGGTLAVVVMGRFCIWEILYFLAKGQFKTAFRRFSRKPVWATLDGAAQIETWYYRPNELQQLFSTHANWRRVQLQAIGIALPPSYLNPFFEKRPALLSWLNRLEQKARQAYWARFSDHYWMVFEADAEQKS